MHIPRDKLTINRFSGVFTQYVTNLQYKQNLHGLAGQSCSTEGLDQTGETAWCTVLLLEFYLNPHKKSYTQTCTTLLNLYCQIINQAHCARVRACIIWRFDPDSERCPREIKCQKASLVRRLNLFCTDRICIAEVGVWRVHCIAHSRVWSGAKLWRAVEDPSHTLPPSSSS